MYTTTNTATTTATAQEEPAKLTVPFSACLGRAFDSELVGEYTNPSLGPDQKRKSTALKTTRPKTFPPYLLVRLNRYALGANWVTVKLDAQVPVPLVLDLESYRAVPAGEGEVLMPDEGPAPGAGAGAGTGAGGATAAPDAGIVEQLMSMGFSTFGCQRAALATGNSGVDAASEWIFAHMEDANFNEPLTPQEMSGGGSSGGGGAGTGTAGAAAADPAILAQLTALGFTDEQAAVALSANNGDADAAANWLFTVDPAVLEDAVTAAAVAADGGAAGAPAHAHTGTGAGAGAGAGVPGAGPADTQLLDGPGRYTLQAIISHIGKNLGSGHYVAHVNQGGRWVLYNDEKVALSKQPPLDAGYLYLFRRDA